MKHFEIAKLYHERLCDLLGIDHLIQLAPKKKKAWSNIIDRFSQEYHLVTVSVDHLLIIIGRDISRLITNEVARQNWIIIEQSRTKK